MSPAVCCRSKPAPLHSKHRAFLLSEPLLLDAAQSEQRGEEEA